MQLKNWIFLSFLSASTLAATAEACTNFILTTKDGARINGRSMEFALPLKSQVMIKPRGEKIESPAPNNAAGMSWISKYGYIALNGLEIDTALDGFNEQGLSIGALWQPDSKYPAVDPTNTNNVIALELLGSYILGNFATVAELKQVLPKIQVWAHSIPALGNTPPLHLTVHDRLGSNLVIEFLNGRMEIFDNPVGVLTNAPSFDWHMTNLRNYIDLTNLNHPAVKLDGTTLQPTGQGTGFKGLPGDWTPPARFVKAAAVVNFIQQPATADLGVNTAQHILNIFDIPSGIIKENNDVFEYTQWIVIKDLKNLRLFYRTYEDMTVKSIDLTGENLIAGAKPKILPL